MRIEPVEIYSDSTNGPVLRHPGRVFPGVLIQGDTLHAMSVQADRIYSAGMRVLPEEEREELNELRDKLRELLGHYKLVLVEHGRPMPFAE